MILALRCRHCGRRDEFTLPQLLARLRELGFLRRHAEPSDELTIELAQSAIDDGRWGRCDSCGQSGLGLASSSDEADDPTIWGDARHCERCGAIIPAERLEVFPDSKNCPRCQKQMETGPGPSDHEYCPHCGSIM